MLVRQFSLRQLLVLITACAGISLILSYAYRGHVWALALAAFLVTLVGMLLVQAGLFWFVWLFGVATDWRKRRGSAGAAIADTGLVDTLGAAGADDTISAGAPTELRAVEK